MLEGTASQHTIYDRDDSLTYRADADAEGLVLGRLLPIIRFSGCMVRVGVYTGSRPKRSPRGDIPVGAASEMEGKTSKRIESKGNRIVSGGEGL